MPNELPILRLPASTASYEYDCQKCGACCAHFAFDDLRDIGRRGRGIFISDDNTEGLPDSLVVAVRCGLGHDKWLRAKLIDDLWRCKALEGTIGQACACGVYELRPATCRTFEPGGHLCRTARFAVLEFTDEQSNNHVE